MITGFSILVAFFSRDYDDDAAKTLHVAALPLIILVSFLCELLPMDDDRRDLSGKTEVRNHMTIQAVHSCSTSGITPRRKTQHMLTLLCADLDV